MHLNYRAIQAGGFIGFFPLQALAHNPLTRPDDGATILAALILLVFWLAYLIGSLRLKPAKSQWLLFNLAGVISIFTVFGPLDHWAETNEAAHMTQHMLMMTVIAPLWVIARPLPQWHALHADIASKLFTPLLLTARHPLLAASIHGAVIWLWHAPNLYILALENLWWHLFEHVCFLLTAGVFWWAVLRSQQRNTGHALLALLATLMHTGFLGALMTFSDQSWYGPQRDLQNQHLAGVLMWVLGGIPYMAAAWYLGWRWFKRIGAA